MTPEQLGRNLRLASAAWMIALAIGVGIWTAIVITL